MRFLARFAMRGPLYAAASAAATMFAALSIGLFVIPSGAIVGLVTLRHGSRKGIEVLVLASAGTVAVRLVTGGDGLAMLVLCLIVWLPAWLMAINLGRTKRQALPLMMIAVLVGAYAVAVRLAVGDVAAFWAQRLDVLFDALAEDGGPRLAPEQVAGVAAQLHLWTLVAMFVMLAATILLARWWQAALFNPGGFGAEFRELSLPRVVFPVALAASLVFAADRFAGAGLPIAGDAFVIVVVLFAFQGLAVIHYRARAVTLARGWLAGLYVMLMLTPQIVGPILATTGIADGFADFRRLTPRRGGAED